MPELPELINIAGRWLVPVREANTRGVVGGFNRTMSGLRWAKAQGGVLLGQVRSGLIPVASKTTAGAKSASLKARQLAIGARSKAEAAALRFNNWRKARASRTGGSLWQSRFPGVQVRQIGNHWAKRVNPNSNRFVQAWGQRTINQQAGALSRLQAAGRPAAGSRLTSSGRLIVEDVGKPLSRWNYLNPAYWRARIADARAMGGAGRVFNDLRPGNYGAGFRAFDPALDPGVGALGIGGGTAIGGGVLWWTLSGDE